MTHHCLPLMAVSFSIPTPQKGSSVCNPLVMLATSGLRRHVFVWAQSYEKKNQPQFLFGEDSCFEEDSCKFKRGLIGGSIKRWNRRSPKHNLSVFKNCFSIPHKWLFFTASKTGHKCVTNVCKASRYAWFVQDIERELPHWPLLPMTLLFRWLALCPAHYIQGRQTMSLKQFPTRFSAQLLLQMFQT